MDYIWTSHCQNAFDTLKGLLTEAPVLAFPEFEQAFILETDASIQGLGAVLAQRQADGTVRPVSYASRSLQNHEKNYGITELEGLAAVWAIKHFRPYLYGHHTDLYTDHEALKSLLNTPQPSGKLARWGMAIQEMDVSILHRAGRTNMNADALSRFPLPDVESQSQESVPIGIVAATEIATPVDGLRERQRNDQELMDIINLLEKGILPDDQKLAKQLALTKSQYMLQDDVLYHVESDGTLRVIPPKDSRQNLFRQVHEGVFGAHLRDAKIYSELKRHYWWPEMRSDIGR